MLMLRYHGDATKACKVAISTCIIATKSKTRIFEWKKKKKSREKEKGGEGRRGEREIHTEEWRKAEVGQGGSVFRVFFAVESERAREANPPRSFCTVYCDLKSIYVRPPRRSALIIHGQKKLTINDRVESARLISGFPAAKLMKHATRATVFRIFVIYLS